MNAVDTGKMNRSYDSRGRQAQARRNRQTILSIDRERRKRMRQNARTLADRGDLKSGVTLEDAADILWTYSSPELYELLVTRCGWNLTRYGRFLADSIAAALLPDA